eukprot:symbB.v1.2.031082.t2/scaffold3512.1/size84356/3
MDGRAKTLMDRQDAAKKADQEKDARARTPRAPSLSTGSKSPRRNASVGPTLSTAQRAGRKSNRASEKAGGEETSPRSRSSQEGGPGRKSRDGDSSFGCAMEAMGSVGCPRGSLLSPGDVSTTCSDSDLSEKKVNGVSQGGAVDTWNKSVCPSFQIRSGDAITRVFDAAGDHAKLMEDRPSSPMSPSRIQHLPSAKEAEDVAVPCVEKPRPSPSGNSEVSTRHSGSPLSSKSSTGLERLPSTPDSGAATVSPVQPATSAPAAPAAPAPEAPMASAPAMLATEPAAPAAKRSSSKKAKNSPKPPPLVPELVDAPMEELQRHRNIRLASEGFASSTSGVYAPPFCARNGKCATAAATITSMADAAASTSHASWFRGGSAKIRSPSAWCYCDATGKGFRPRSCCGNRMAVPNNCIDTYIKCLWCQYYFSTGLPSVEAGICPGPSWRFAPRQLLVLLFFG